METTKLLEWWERATAADRAAGEVWYRVARREARRLARTYGVSFRCAAAIIAVLSPRLQWGPNLRAAETVLRDGDCAGVFRVNVAKARALRNGGRPADYVRGDKVTAFYRAIIGDDASPVADVWMMRAAGHVPEDLSSRDYRAVQGTVAGAIVAAAAAVGVPVVALQATVWVAIRGRAD